MRKIVSIKWASSEKDSVNVLFDDEDFVFVPKEHRMFVEIGADKMESDGLIEEWLTADEAKSLKESECRHWRDDQLQSILPRIEQYERDQLVAPEYKTTPLTTAEYEELLRYRKALCDYPQDAAFPDCDKPTTTFIDPSERTVEPPVETTTEEPPAGGDTVAN